MKRLIMVLLVGCIFMTGCGQTPASDISPDASAWQEQYDLGIRYLSEGKYEEAIIAFTAAIEIDSKHVQTYCQRGTAYMKLAEALESVPAENFEAAEKDYLKVLSMDKTVKEIYSKLADLYLMFGDVERATAILLQGYEATGDETLKERANTIETLPTDLMKGSIIVSMYESNGEFCGHDAYTFDNKQRMTSNTWYDFDNTPIASEVWTYDDLNNVTMMVRRETDYDEESIEGDYKVVETEEYFDGCENQGWFWYDMGDEQEGFITDPTLESDSGQVMLTEDDNRQANYYYDEQGRVWKIETFNASGVLLGYCIVSYGTDDIFN